MLLSTVSLLCKTTTIYSRLTPRSTCKKTLATFRGNLKKGRTTGTTLPQAHSGADRAEEEEHPLRLASCVPACLSVGEMKGAVPSTRLSISAQ